MSKSSLPTSTTAFLSLVKPQPGAAGANSSNSFACSDPTARDNADVERHVERHVDKEAAMSSNSDSGEDTEDFLLHAPPLSSRVLWLAVYFPQLAVEMPLGAPDAACSQSQACAVAVEKIQARSVIHTVSQAAAEFGICVGMSLNAAYSLHAGLDVRGYDEKQQRRYMEKLAAWAMQFSSQVSVADSATLLLEIKGSLRYYGGMQSLLRQFETALAAFRPHRIKVAVAPTAAASVLLAKTQRQLQLIQDYRRLRGALSAVYINELPLSRQLKQRLRRLGLRQLQDLWRLPRQDLSRRYGEALVIYLDALIGMNTEVLDYYQLPDHFTCQWHLDYETRDACALTRIVTRLLEKLEEYLIQCDYHIHAYRVELINAKKKPYLINVGLRKPGRQLSHLVSLFEEQIKHVTIEEKICSIKLHSRHLVKASAHSASLAFSPEFLQAQGDEDIAIDDLLDLIQARLGRVAVKSIGAVADHRPECAGTATSVDARAPGEKAPLRRKLTVAPLWSSLDAAKSGQWKQRPLWLLPDPHPLRMQQQQPVYGDILQLLSGPERIEAAWWSDHDVRRDYYCAMTPNGQRLWIYQELNAPYKWYLHGFFA